MQETLSFEAMPQAILELMHKVDTLRADISELKECSRTQTPEPMIGIDEAPSRPSMRLRRHTRFLFINPAKCSSSNARN